MKAISNNIRASFTELGQMEVTLALTAKQDISDLKQVIADKKLLVIEIKQHRKKRSLDANSYAWVIVTKIADALKTSKDEVYIEMLKRYGQREPKLLSVVADAADMIYRATNNHCCEVGESELNGKLFKHLAILIGSSQYDSKDMATLIDGIISEAKGIGIETMTDREKAEMISKWGMKE